MEGKESTCSGDFDEISQEMWERHLKRKMRDINNECIYLNLRYKHDPGINEYFSVITDRFGQTINHFGGSKNLEESLQYFRGCKDFIKLQFFKEAVNQNYKKFEENPRGFAVSLLKNNRGSSKSDKARAELENWGERTCQISSDLQSKLSDYKNILFTRIGIFDDRTDFDFIKDKVDNVIQEVHEKFDIGSPRSDRMLEKIENVLFGADEFLTDLHKVIFHTRLLDAELTECINKMDEMGKSVMDQASVIEDGVCVPLFEAEPQKSQAESACEYIVQNV